MPPLLILALSTAAPVAPPPAKQTTLQQDFDAATDAALAKDCEKAIPMFEALERNPKIKPRSLPAAAIAVRKGICLTSMVRMSEGEQSILAGLPILEKAGAEFNFDVATSYNRLGNAALFRWDYGQAKQRYEKALAVNVPALRPVILAGLVHATTFDGGPDALRYADQGIAAVSADEKPSKDILATFNTLKARALLRQGENEQAYATLKEALRLSGGLTSKTTLGEASMRGDLALAAMLLGKKDEARRYLAYTGAGRIVASPFAIASEMSPPDCGDDTGLRPEDFAVVEFGIDDDGSVNSAQTVYSMGGPKVAAAFASAVSQWYWQPESLKKIPPFYRVATRVELRCSAAGGPSPSVLTPSADRFEKWAATHTRARKSGEERPEFVEALRRELAEKKRTQDLPGEAATLGLLAIADIRAGADAVAMLDRAIALRSGAVMPTEAVNALRIFRMTAAAVFGEQRKSKRRYRHVDDDSILTLAKDPEIAADPLAAATLQLLLREPQSAALQQIADSDKLPPHHPLRQVALLKLANRAAGSGDITSAQAFFAKTGLTEQQCALIGAKPALRQTGAGPGDFPQEAMMYGFEGWVRLEFDITADGRTANARPLIAYPPFVFVDAAKGMTRGIRYETSYRPSGGVACNANRETIRFILPYLRQ